MVKPTDAEDEYFLKEEAERRAAHRAKLAQAAAELQAFGTDRPEVAERIKSLGFDGDSAAAFHLLPLVFVAWADGSVTRRERLVIFRALNARGHARDSDAGHLLESLLEEMPSQEWHDEALSLLHEVVGDKLQAKDILKLCADVADASGGLFGFGTVSDAEWKVIEEIATELGDDGRKAFEKSVDEL